MKDTIGYQRVSTREQGRSGLGLAAQRYDIEAFGAREGFRVKSWYQDIQTGAGKDAHKQLSAGRVIIGYQNSFSCFPGHLPSVIRKQWAVKLYFFGARAR